MTEQEKIMVSVICITYNQERYIRKAIEGFLMQEVDFPYEILIHDDASTDSTADICREYEMKYPDLIKVIYEKENQYSQGILPDRALLERARGKYIAYCEGDDFWTNKDKLKKQVNFMETHEDYSVCFHATYESDNDGKIKDKAYRHIGRNMTLDFEKILQGEFIFATSSVFYRKNAIPELYAPFLGDCVNGDVVRMIYLAMHGKVYYMEELLSAYRTESVGSINQKWKNDKKKFAEDRMKFVEMLYRVDQLTQLRYHTIIENRVDKMRFSLALMTYDVKEAKKYAEEYKHLTLRKKAVLFFGAYIPKGEKIIEYYRNLIN